MLFLLNLEIISILILSVLRGRIFMFLYLMIIVVVEAVFGLRLLLSQIRRFGNDKVLVL
jgi:NADH:ubiquinone oxidoreductase subunit K